MPELPEVETTVRGLKKQIIGCVIKGVWTDWPKYFKLPETESEFHKNVIGKKINGVERRGKNILIYLQPNRQALGKSNSYILLIHQKLSGHLMVGSWIKNSGLKAKLINQKIGEKWQDQKWLPEKPTGPLTDPKNRFLRLIFFLQKPTARYSSSDTQRSILNTQYSVPIKMLALSDLRRFGKIMCAPKETILNLPDVKKLGPEPLAKNFTFETLKSVLKNKKGSIKKNLLDQNVMSGIGNIYADEILWQTKIHPLVRTESLNPPQIQKIFRAIKTILPLAIKRGGTSMDDYRHVTGQRGGYEKYLLAYQKTGEPCERCQTKIQRIKIGLRSSHFCPKCQKNNP